MKAVLVLLASVTFAIAPLLSPDFGGFDPERYPIPQENSPVQPAGWSFAIWGIIYLVLIVHAFVGLIRHKQHKQHKDWDSGRLPLFISLAVGTSWLTVATVSPVWATILIIIMLVCALMALYRMRNASPAWVAMWPIALYAGWLTAATFISLGLLLAGYGVLSETTAAIVALACAMLFALVNQLKLTQWPYAAAVAWGFTGIAVANLGEQGLISLLAAVAAVALLVMTAFQLRRDARHQPDFQSLTSE